MSQTPSAARPSPPVLWAMVLLGISAISVASILIRLAEAPAIAIAAYRVTIAALVLSPFYAAGRGSRARQRDRRALAFTCLAGVFLAFHFLLWIRSLSYTSVASSATLVGTTPLFTALFSFLWLKERPGNGIVPGIICTVLGSALIAGTDFSFSVKALQGDLLALGGALMAAGYFLAGRVARHTTDLCAYTFGAYGTAALVLLACALAAGTPLSGFSPKTYLMLLLLALIPQLIGHTTFNWTLRFLSPATVAVLILGEPIGATLLAFLVLEETIPPLRGLGLLILGAGILLSALAEPQAAPQCCGFKVSSRNTWTLPRNGGGG